MFRSRVVVFSRFYLPHFAKPKSIIAPQKHAELGDLILQTGD